MIGETTGRKLCPATVARQMKVARDADGQRLFTHKEILPSTQIQSFFSRRAKCKNQEEPATEKDYEAAENEDGLSALRNEVLEKCSPGICLCTMATICVIWSLQRS